MKRSLPLTAAVLMLGGVRLVSAQEPWSIIVCPATESNPRQTEGDIIELNDGRLLLAWSDFYGGAADDAAARISAKMSDDGGRTWGESLFHTLQENVGQQNVMSVTLQRLQNGEIAFYYGQKDSRTKMDFYVRFSGDEAQTWSDPVLITTRPAYHVMNNARVVQLKSGRIIAPLESCEEVWSANEHIVAWCAISDDNGRTWRPSNNTVDCPRRGAMEPGVVELKDGRLLMIIRTQMGRIHRAFSSDQGETWTEAEATDIVAPEAPATLARIPGTGDLMLVWNHNYEEGAGHCGARRPLTVAISPDEGETWTHERNLETKVPQTYAYTSVTFVGDDVLLTYYVMEPQPGGGHLLHLKLTRLPVQWLYE